MTSPKLSIAYLLNTVNSDIDTPSSFFASSERSHVLDPTSSDDSSIDEPKTLQPANRKRKWDHACCATTTTSTSSTSTDRSLHATAQTQDCQTINHHNLNNHDDIRNNISSRKKRPLRRYSDEILDCLIAAYDVNSRPCEDTLMMLANQLGLSPYQVKTWFQNRRSRQKEEDTRIKRRRPLKRRSSTSVVFHQVDLSLERWHNTAKSC